MEDSVMKMAKAIPTNITAYIGHASQLHLFFGQKTEIATALDNKGYGNTKQAQIEILKELKAEFENYRSIERTQLLGTINGYIAKLEN